MQPLFFKTKADLRKWFVANYKTATTLQLGYYKVTSGRESISWPDSVDEALCFGWIDGVRHSIDEESYTIRFTHRKPTSIWSAINLAKVEKLLAAGLMYPEGIAAYEKRKDHRSKIYAYEMVPHTLHPEYEKQMKANKKAWAFFSTIAPSYRKLGIHRVMSAKQEATRNKRFEALLQACANEEKFWQLPR
jgi:uncharacterized protein YdeI (YjbR/CyaY-like superfamily)